uniref:glycoside hydrolase family 20 zincin-like fold domain-containing protein n=1 Tax=Fodinicola feengrottensis TaxID=435914 RepID=UPI0013D44841
MLAAGERSGTPVVALSGVDPTGTFYAAQTLRQLIVPGSPARLPGVQVRDWPGFFPCVAAKSRSTVSRGRRPTCCTRWTFWASTR